MPASKNQSDNSTGGALADIFAQTDAEANVRQPPTRPGGAMAGIGGAFLSLVQVPIWGEGMTAGRGWIALGLVVFASWQPFRIIFGAILFGGITILQIHAQGLNINVSAQYLSMLPYLATIVILVSLRMRLKNKTNRTVPNCLGRIFHSTT